MERHRISLFAKPRVKERKREEKPATRRSLPAAVQPPNAAVPSPHVHPCHVHLRPRERRRDRERERKRNRRRREMKGNQEKRETKERREAAEEERKREGAAAGEGNRLRCAGREEGSRSKGEKERRRTAVAKTLISALAAVGSKEEEPRSVVGGVRGAAAEQGGGVGRKVPVCMEEGGVVHGNPPETLVRGRAAPTYDKISSQP